MTAITLQRQPSDITATDVFCGAGGNTIGAKRKGVRVRCALNHWDRAIETYGTNNPEVDVIERVDVSVCDPRRYPTTDIGIFSPECTTHSPAGGNKHRSRQPTLFDSGKPLDPATVRSRVTMFDVVRFTEYHRYNIVIVENVVEATRWELFPDWLRMMDHLGYQHRILSINSMFHHPTPQSRDRIYVVFWRNGIPAPDLEHRPVAPCARCGNVEARQAWKNGRTVGKYRQQYIFVCSRCGAEVRPFYFAALNALDLTLPATRIGDREASGKKALQPKTMERIAYGLEKYGRRQLLVKASSTSGLDCRVQDPSAEPFPTQATYRHHGLVQPPGFLLDITQAGASGDRTRGMGDAFATQTCQQSSALVTFPFVVSAGGRETAATAGTDPMPAQLTYDRLGVVQPFAVQMRGTGDDQVPYTSFPLDAAFPAVSAGGVHSALIQGSALMTLRDSAGGYLFRTLDEATGAQVASCPQDAVISRAPFLAAYYGTDNLSPVEEANPAVTTKDRHALVTPGEQLRAEDCYFRMVECHEVGAAMAFPREYRVQGSKRDRVKQFGNAVTPPVMDWIVGQCLLSLAPELGEVA